MCCTNKKKPLQDVLLAQPRQGLKISLVGDIGVGKTSLALRFSGEAFNVHTNATICVDILRTKLALDNGSELSVCLWDTAGQEKFNSIVRSTVRSSDAVVMVYSMDSRTSIHKLMYTWYPLVRDASPGFKELLVVGNKSDLEREENKQDMDDSLASFCELLRGEKVRFVLVKISAALADQATCAEVFEAFVRRIAFTHPEAFSLKDLSNHRDGT